MSVVLDATGTGGRNFNAGSTTFSWSHVCSAGANALYVLLAGQNTVNVTGVTYNGVAMTKLDNRGSNEHVSIWYLENPASGSNTVEVTTSGSGNEYMGGGSVSFEGVGGHNQILDKTGGSSPNVSETNTSTVDEGFMITALGFNDPSSLTYTGGGTEFSSEDRGPGKAQRHVYNEFTGGANENETWTNGANRGYDIMSYEVYPAASAVRRPALVF